jgi:hypothetical protein
MEENFKQIYAEYEVEERDSIVLEVPDDSTKEEQRLIATPLIHNKYNNATIKEIYL